MTGSLLLGGRFRGWIEPLFPPGDLFRPITRYPLQPQPFFIGALAVHTLPARKI
jgi:hypothetical protein